MTPRDVQDYEAQARELLREIHHGDPLLNMEQAALHLGKIAAALRAEGRAALERAAQLCQDDATYQERGDPRGMALSTAARRIRALIAPAPESPPATVEGFDKLAPTSPVAPAPGLRKECGDNSPEWWTGRWQDWHRGHGCGKDDGKPTTPEGVAEFAAHGRLPGRAPAPSQVAPTEPQPEPPRWRIGRHYGIHVYCGDTPIATFHAVENAQAAVRAYNANLDRSAPAPALAAQLDELSNALASHADAETGAKWDRLRAAVGARDERMAALEAALRKICAVPLTSLGPDLTMRSIAAGALAPLPAPSKEPPP